MEARLKNIGDVLVISISGSLTIEETQPFREAFLKKFGGRRVVFNMARASFVGSTGIQAFLETLQGMDQKNDDGVRVVAVRSEFRRMITSLEARKIEIFEDEGLALKDWLHPSATDSGADSTRG